MFQKHPVNAKINTSLSSVGGGTEWPVGFTLDNFLDLFTNVKSFDFNFYSIPQGLGAFSTSLDVIDLVSQGVGEGDAVATATGRSQRQTRLLGELTASGNEASASQYPFTTRNYPYFSMGGLGVVAFVDFGRTRFLNGLFYPRIVIQFSNGPASNGGGGALGTVIFANQSIPIYSGSGNGLFLVAGSIAIAERFDSILPSKTRFKVGESMTLTRGASFFDFSKIKFAYFGSARAAVNATTTTLTVVIPPNAESGPIRFESVEPQLDSFSTIFEIVIYS